MPKVGTYPRGGRPKGVKNKTTIERERLEIEALQSRARSIVLKPLAKDELEALIPEAKELIGVVKGAVAGFQRAAMTALPGSPDFDAAAWERLQDWMALYAEVLHKAAQIAHKAADFQSPKFKAIAVDMRSSTGPAPATIGADNVRRIDDPNAAARVYLQVVKGGKT